MKKIVLILLIACFIVPCISVYAGQEDDVPGTFEEESADRRDLDWYIKQPGNDEDEENQLAETEQFLVDLTNRDLSGSKLVFSRTYMVYGLLKEPDVKVIAAMFDGEAYEELSFEDNCRGIPLSTLGHFAQDVELSEGTNRIKIVAYLETALEEPEPGINMQISYITVKYYSYSEKEQVLNSERRITDVFYRIKQSLGGE